MTAIATKFVQWDVQPLESLKGSKAYDLREKLNSGEKMDSEEKKWLTYKVNTNAYFKCSIPVMGWRFDFSDVLKTFLVNEYGQWREYMATDKTSLRSILLASRSKIVELQN